MQDSSPTEIPELVTPTPAATQIPQEDMVFDDIEKKDEKANASNGGKADTDQSNRWIFTILKICIIMILIVVALEGQRRIRKRIFLKNMRKKKAKRRIRMAYLHLMPVWIKYSVIYRDQSIRKFTEEISSAMALPESDVALFVELLFHARFGPDTISEEQLREFGRVYKTICQKAYADAKWIRKLYYMYIMVL